MAVHCPGTCPNGNTNLLIATASPPCIKYHKSGLFRWRLCFHAMEEARELQPSGILDKILPPRLEDSVIRATTAAKFRATSILAGEDGSGSCVNDPQPDSTADVLTGVQPERDPPGPCTAVKGGPVEVGGDEVVVMGGDGVADEVAVGGAVVDGEEEHGACVDGLQGLEDRAQGSGPWVGAGVEVDEDEEEKEEDAIIVEGVA